jgi:hypothetical protein
MLKLLLDCCVFRYRKALTLANIWLVVGCVLVFGPRKVSSFLAGVVKRISKAVVKQ